MPEARCRIAPSLGGGFAGTPEEVWGTKPYNQRTDRENPCVFFGMYGMKDLDALYQHTGKKWIFWAGSDIRNFINGYWLDDIGENKLKRSQVLNIAKWMSENCESWVENSVERDALLSFGILSNVCPSFLGNIDDYDVSFIAKNPVRLYTSVSGDDFELYGWPKIDDLAEKNNSIEFHLYGNTMKWKTKKKNVIVHGRVSQKQMDEETKRMSGALRLTEFDGFSEILAKSVLWGQYPVSIIEYPGILPVERINLVKNFTKPNMRARDFYRKIINKFPWNQKTSSEV